MPTTNHCITYPSCKHFSGTRPCALDRDQVCIPHCKDLDVVGPQVLVVRGTHLGNTVKTTPILVALKKLYPNCEITWMASPLCCELVRYNPKVKRVLHLDNPGDWAFVNSVSWDLVLSLDVDPRAIAIASRAMTKKMLGYTIDIPSGRITFKGSEFEYIYRLGIDNELRFKVNQTPLHELYFEMLGVEYAGERYEIALDSRGVYDGPVYSRDWKAIGLYIGGYPDFANKQWPVDHWAELARLLVAQGYVPVALGGPQDIITWKKLYDIFGRPTRYKGRNTYMLDGGLQDPLLNSIWNMSGLSCVVSTDGFRLHAAVSCGIPVVALHGPTPWWEAPLFGKGQHVLAEDCVHGPCYAHHEWDCRGKDGPCMFTITPEVVMEAVMNVTTKETEMPT